MDFPLNLQKDVEAARLTLLRRRAYVSAITDAFTAEDLEVAVDPLSAKDFADQATDAQRERFFEEAPAELAAAFILSLSPVDRGRLIAKLALFDRDLFVQLFEGL